MKKIWLTLLRIWHNICSMSKKKNPYVKGLENKIERLEQQLTNKLVDAADEGQKETSQEAFFIRFNQEKKVYEFVTLSTSSFKEVSVKNLGDAKHRVSFELNKMVAHETLLPKEK